MPKKRLALTKVTPYRHAPRPLPEDHRKITPGRGQQGSTMCTRCGAEVTVKKADTGDINEDLGILRHDRIVSPHVEGGGKVSVMRGDVRCPGSGLPAA